MEKSLDSKKREKLSKVILEILKIAPLDVSFNVDLSKFSTWKIGGVADVMISPSSMKQLSAIITCFYNNKINYMVIGATSNLLFSDEGLRIPCIQIGPKLSKLSINRNTIEADAGVWAPNLARAAAQNNLKGIEHICGIPGNLGGLICMNGGSMRNNISDSIVTITSIDKGGKVHVRTPSECNFSYRNSIFKNNLEIITSAKFSLERGDKKLIRQNILKILKERNSKFPRKTPNCGSVFKSNPIMYSDIGPPGLVIEKLGFKGYRIGGALVSPLHANFIVNDKYASAKDVLSIIHAISSEVFSQTGYKLEAEACFVHSSGEIIAADQINLNCL